MIALAALYAVLVAGVALVARALRRPIPWGALLAFALVPVLLFPSTFRGDQTILPLEHVRMLPPWSGAEEVRPYNPNVNDAVLQFLPWTKAVRMAWKEGSLPLRDRWNGCGTPLAANGQSAAFSPFTLAGLVLPLVAAFTLAVAAKVLLAMAGMWLFTRELGASPSSALLAAVAFGLSFAMTPWLLFPHTAVVCLWPWMLFAIELLRGEERARGAVALTLVFAAMALGGHPESLVLGCLFALLWLLLRGAWRPLAATALCGAAAAGLTAWLLLPQLLAILASSRFASLETLPWERFLSAAPHGPAWPGGLFAPLLPFTWGEAIASPMLPGAPSAFPELGLGYVGIATWAVALLVLRRGSPRRREEWVLLALVLAGVAAAVAQWPATELASQIPLLRAMTPLRFFAWAALAAPALAALELTRYASDASAAKRPWIALAAAAVVLALLAAAVHAAHRPLHAAAGGQALQRQQLIVAVAALAVAAAAAVILRRRAAVLGVVLAVVSGVELAAHARHLYRLRPAAGLYPETPLVRFLEEREGTFRTVGQGPALNPNTNVFAGVEDVRVWDPVESRAYVDFLSAACGFDRNAYYRPLANLDAPALDFLNVRYLVAPAGAAAPGAKWTAVYAGADGAVFENAAALPRVFSPFTVRFGPPPADVASTEDWRRVAFVDDRTRQGSAGNGPAAISDYRETTNVVRFRARAGPGGSVVVASLTDDGGWSARTGTGTPLRVLAANGPFLAIEVPEGDHHVTLRYLPPGFRLGLGISGATLLVVAAAAWRGRRRRLNALRTGT